MAKIQVEDEGLEDPVQVLYTLRATAAVYRYALSLLLKRLCATAG